MFSMLFFVAVGLRGGNGAQHVGFRDTDIAAQAATPRNAGSRWSPMDFNVAMALPNGWTYCPLPENRNGMDRAQTFFLEPPSACDRPELKQPWRWLPSVHVELEVNHLDISTVRDVAGRKCPRPEVLTGIQVLGHPAVGCRVIRGDTVELDVFDLVRTETQPRNTPPVGILTLTLRTSAARAGLDRTRLASVAAGVYLCARSGEARPGRPQCPPDGPW
jgi:hypothetical protein